VTAAPRVRIAERLLTVGALLWTVALPLAAWLRDVPGGVAVLFTFLVYGVGSVVCHQQPERSFSLGATPLPVCARCAGIYAGVAAVALMALVGCRLRVHSPRNARAWLAATAAPVVASLLYEWGTGRIPSNLVRAATGALIGAAAAAIVLSSLDDEVSRGSSPPAER
jgi:uncharacterized membrane protein